MFVTAMQHCQGVSDNADLHCRSRSAFWLTDDAPQQDRSDPMRNE